MRYWDWFDRLAIASIVLGILLYVGSFIAVAYVVIHFISKYW